VRNEADDERNRPAMRLRDLALKFIVTLSFLALQQLLEAQMGTPSPLSSADAKKHFDEI
jgi:hypothetical protein